MIAQNTGGTAPYILNITIRCKRMFTFMSLSLLSKLISLLPFGTIILPVVLYGCETWSLILREERKLRVFKNMV